MKITKTSGDEACPQPDTNKNEATVAYDASTASGEEQKKGSFSKDLTFTKAAKDCVYTVEQAQKAEALADYANWTEGGEKYTLTLSATMTGSTAAAKIDKVTLTRKNPNKPDSEPETTEVNADGGSYKLNFTNQYAAPVEYYFLKEGTTVPTGGTGTASTATTLAKAVTDGEATPTKFAGSRLKVEAGEKLDAAKVPTDTKYCKEDGKKLLGWQQVTFATTGNKEAQALDGNLVALPGDTAPIADQYLEAVCVTPAKAKLKVKVSVLDNGTEKTGSPVAAEVPAGAFSATLALKDEDGKSSGTCPTPDPKPVPVTKAGDVEFPEMTFEHQGPAATNSSSGKGCVYEASVKPGEASGLWNTKTDKKELKVTTGYTKATTGPSAAPASLTAVQETETTGLQLVAPVTVKLHANGTDFGSGLADKTLTGKNGETVTPPTNAEMNTHAPAGKTFLYWAKESAGTNLVAPENMKFDAATGGAREFYATWGTAKQVEFYAEDGKTLLGTQTVGDSAQFKLQRKFVDQATGKTVDLATANACSKPGDVVTQWHDTGKIATAGNTNTNVFYGVVTGHDASKKYSAVCATPKVTFEGGSDTNADNNGTFKVGDKNETKLELPLAELNQPGFKVPELQAPKAAGEKKFYAWHSDRQNKTFDKDLKDPVTGEPYVPENGDTLVAQFGYEVTYQDNQGQTLGVEYYTSGTPTGAFFKGGDTSHKTRCQGLTAKDTWTKMEDGKPAADGQGKTLSGFVNHTAVLRAECSDAPATLTFNAGEGAKFLDRAVKDVNHWALNPEHTVLTLTMPEKTTPFNGVTAPGQRDIVKQGYKLDTTSNHEWKQDRKEPDTYFAAGNALNQDSYTANWAKVNDKVAVTFAIPRGGDGTAPEAKNYTYGEPLGNMAGKVCGSKTFTKWTSNDTTQEDYTPDTPVRQKDDGNTMTLTLTAVCSDKPATPAVTFDANGGKFAEGVNPVVEIKDGKVEFTAVPKLDGKVFTGWCTEKPGEDGKCAEGKEFKNEGLKDSVTVYASYAPSFKVTFDLNGGKFAEGVASEAQTDKDGKVAKPADPTLAGKVFSKWCVVPAEGELDEAKCADFDFAKAIDKDTTLKAVYKTAVTVKLQPGIKDAKAVEKPVAEGSKVKELDTTGMCAEGFDFSKWDADDEATVEAGKTYTATCAAHVDKVKVTVKVGTETKSVEVVKGSKLTLEALKTAGVTCGEGQALKLTKADGTVFSLDTAISEAIELTAKCEAKSTPGGSTGGSTGGSSSGGSYFGGGSGGSSTPSTPAKDKKPGDKKPGDKKPGAKQPVVNKFDKQFTKKVELPKSAVKRAAGADRVATSVAALSLAKNHEVVVLATGSNFPDALVGGALAGAYKAGVVLTTGATLEQSVLDSLKSYKTKTVHIVGGNGAVSLAKEAQLRAAGLEVVRHAGADRYATAQAVKAATLKALGGKSAISCNATGSNFPDALACSSAASQMGGVVDLVKPGTAVAKDATAKTVCAGGPACQAAGAGVDKVVGSDRYETAYKLAEMTPAKGSVLVSNGQSYADSLVAGALAGSLQADLVLAKPSRVNVPAGTKSAQLFGGTTVLPDSLSMYTK